MFNKITVFLESVLSSLNWSDGVCKYKKLKGLLSVNEHISGPPDLDDELDDAKEFRRRLSAADAQPSSPMSSLAKVATPRIKTKVSKHRRVVAQTSSAEV